MKTNYKKLIGLIIITFIIGGLFAVFTTTGSYQNLNKPFEIPSAVFPAVWTTLYLLMGISAYIISEDGGNLKIYFIQLVVNSLWTLFFFGFKLYLFSFFWIIFLIVLVILMLYYFSNINKTALYLNVPYLLWLIFAAYLNFMIYYLN